MKRKRGNVSHKAVTVSSFLKDVSKFTWHFVRDDGSCWMYAPLSCLGLIEHSTANPWEEVGGKAEFAKGYRPSPSERDRSLDKLVREKIWEAMSPSQKRGYKTRSLDNEGRHVDLTVSHSNGETLGDLAPLYSSDGQNCLKLGSFGSEVEYILLAQVLQVDMCWWSARKREKMTTLFHADGTQSEEGVSYFLSNYDKPTVHVAWSTVLNDHVDSFIPRTPINWKPPDWIVTFLENYREGNE